MQELSNQMAGTGTGTGILGRDQVCMQRGCRHCHPLLCTPCCTKSQVHWGWLTSIQIDQPQVHRRTSGSGVSLGCSCRKLAFPPENQRCNFSNTTGRSLQGQWSCMACWHFAKCSAVETAVLHLVCRPFHCKTGSGLLCASPHTFCQGGQQAQKRKMCGFGFRRHMDWNRGSSFPRTQCSHCC